MKDLVTVTAKAVPAGKNEQRMSLGLQSRLLYLLLKCPLLQQKRECACGRAVGSSKGTSVSRRLLHADDEEVVLQVTVPYALRRAAREAHLDCNALVRKTLSRQLKKAARRYEQL